ncbi:MAG TPA: ABC transporter permease, partial [Acidobacteriaceae bacterium]|nr:ABC transporter permease [Acidobacteriaceae bacterium]
GRSRKDQDLAEEIQAHLAHHQDAHIARGLAPEEARRQANIRFGNPQVTREKLWRYRSFPTLEDLLRDLRFAIRSLRKTPAVTAICILVLAVGIGVNTAVFSVINTVLLQPLTYPDPQALVELANTSPRGTFPGANIPKFSLWRQQSSIFQTVAAYDWGGSGLNITDSDHPQQVQAIHVSADYFALFGAPIAAGRTFTSSEDMPNGGHVTVLSYNLWKTRYASNPSVVGHTIQLDGQPYTIVGVIGRGFVTDAPADLWVPFQFDLNSQDMAHYFTVSARLRPGITIPAANAQLHLAADQFRRLYGTEAIPPDGGFGVLSLQQSTIGDIRQSLLVLFAAVGFVLLIACANVANLLLARATARRREFATRAALGAGRFQIIRQLLIESLTLSLSGGFFGLILGYTGLRLLLRINPGNIPRVGEDGASVALDSHILLFTLGLSLLTGLLFGLVPAVAATRSNLTAALNENNNSGASVRSGKLRSILVISEMALTVILVIGATLLIRTFQKLQSVDLGFATHNIVSMSMSISGDRFQTTAPVAQIIREGTDRLLAVPGVVNAAVTNCLPMAGGFGMSFDIVGRPKGSPSANGGGGFHSISYGYFDTLKIPILSGRAFTRQDDAGHPLVIIINQALARQYWQNGADPLKDRILIGADAGPAFAEGPRQIIGVVGDTHDGGPNNPPFPIFYIPLAQMPDLETALNSRVAPLWWVVRGNVDPLTLTPQITSELRQASGGLPVAHIRSMEESEARNIARQRFNMLLLTVFGSSGLLMAAIGIFGVLSYSVEQRTHELGIRMALGAQTTTLRNMILRHAMLLTLIGVILGSAGALWCTRFLASFLFGVKPLDLAAFLATPILLGIIALISAWIPARRATRVDPMTALRTE